MDEEEDEVQYKGGEEMIEEEEQGGGGANHLGADLHLRYAYSQPASRGIRGERPDGFLPTWFSPILRATNRHGHVAGHSGPPQLVLMWHSPA